jgi:hypothetical protein
MRIVRKAIGTCRELGIDTPAGLYSLVARQLCREWNAYGLRRDLRAPWEPPAARIPLTVRVLREEDIAHLFQGESEACSRLSRLEVMHRMAFLAERVPTPFVAIDLIHNRPCYLQWLMTATSNNDIQRYFRGRFPVLAPDEALLEYAYTPAAYRGNGIMPAAMAMIAEKAAEVAARYVITFVLRENAAALKGCSKAGFAPYVIRRDRHYFFRCMRRRAFLPISGPTNAYEQGGLRERGCIADASKGVIEQS